MKAEPWGLRLPLHDCILPVGVIDFACDVLRLCIADQVLDEARLVIGVVWVVGERDVGHKNVGTFRARVLLEGRIIDDVVRRNPQILNKDLIDEALN